MCTIGEGSLHILRSHNTEYLSEYKFYKQLTALEETLKTNSFSYKRGFLRRPDFQLLNARLTFRSEVGESYTEKYNGLIVDSVAHYGVMTCNVVRKI